MPEVQYKFKSSLSFEVIKFNESSITVGVLKDLINQKQSIKTSGFDLKLKDTHGKIYTDDDEAIDLKSKIIVSRVPKVSKAQPNIKKKDTPIANSVTENPIESNIDKLLSLPDEKNGESVKVDPIVEKIEQPIPDILKCCLCNELMKDSMQIKCCKKSYCHECITGYLFDPDISGSLECPDCKSIVSIKDANLVDNMRIRSMVHDFQHGKLDSENVDTVEDIPSTDELLMHLENVQEIEITTDNSNIQEEEIPVKSYENVESTQIDEMLLPDEKNYNCSGSVVVQEQHSPIDPVILNTILASPNEVDQTLMEFSNDKNNNNSSPADVNLIEQHYQGHSYINSLSDQQFPNKSEIPVINTPHISASRTMANDSFRYKNSPNQNNQFASVLKGWLLNVKNKVVIKDSQNSSIQDLDFDPVMYMTFLKIVGENCPDELRKILSNNNDSLHISKDIRKTSTSNRRKEEEYHEKHSSKKPRYEVENEEFKYKKNYIPAEKQHSDHRYYENVEKKSSNRTRSRSKEYYQKKSDGYSSNRRSRDYEVRERDYYPSNGARYRTNENQIYQEDRHKYRPNYDSINRIKSNKYKRPMNR